MDLFEEAVMGFITRDYKTFVIPQFSIGTEGEWSCPDFVAISPANKKCHVIEVSTAYNLGTLAQRVQNKDNQWFDKLRTQLEEARVTDASWVYDVWVFVRKNRVDWFKNIVGDIPSVIVHDIEKTLTPWDWDYEAPTKACS
jgi:hypothetical protein